MEWPDPVAPDDGMEPEPHLVDQAAPREVVCELSASVGDQIAVMLRLQCGHALRRVRAEELRVPGQRLFDRP